MGRSGYNRFIPTRAGNSARLHTRAPSGPVHPHSRGELSKHLGRFSSSSGSSPLAWGTPSLHQLDGNLERFIPTRVGNSLFAKNSGGPSMVHPHSRGELRITDLESIPRDGSSPLAWGTLLLDPEGKGVQRFIPTRVGNSRSGRSRPSGIPVHPHSRGELFSGLSSFVISSGSSPLAWGTQAHH